MFINGHWISPFIFSERTQPANRNQSNTTWQADSWRLQEMDRASAFTPAPRIPMRFNSKECVKKIKRMGLVGFGNELGADAPSTTHF
jgi:hypothetical protein